MDFENMKRKQLQALCKEHGIPANLTNLEMVNKLSSLLKVNDEKPLTRGRSCLKIMDENVNDRESDVVNRKVKKVKFSPENEVIEFTRSAGVKRRGRRKTMLSVGILDSPVRVTRSQGVNMEDGVTEKKGQTRRVNDGVILVSESEDEVGVTTRSLRNKEVVIVQEKKEANEGGNDGLEMSRRVRSWKNAKESVEELKTEELDGAEKRDKKVTFISGGQMNEGTKSETKAKETKRVTRRKPIAHNQTLHVQNEVDAEVREEVVEKPARVTRSQIMKPVEDNVSNKRNRTRGKESTETSEELLRTESSVEVVKDEVRVNTRTSQQNSVVEGPQKALKKSGRVANKAKGAWLTDDVSKEKMITRDRTRNQSTSESGTKIVESKGELEEPVEVPPRRSDRRKSVCPSENLQGDEFAAKKGKRNLLNSNDDEPWNKGTKEESQKALKRSKRLATQVEDSVLAKDDIAENEVVLQTVEVPVRSNRRKSVFPSLEKVRIDEVAVVKEKRNLKATDDEMRSKGTKEPQKASKRSKRHPKQMEDPVVAEGDVAENKLEERRCSRRNAAKINADTKILDRSVQEETSVVKEERRCSGRSAARNTLAEVSDDKKEKSENMLTKRNCTVIQEKDSTNKFSQQDLDSPKQSTNSSIASVEAAVVKKTSTVGKKLQGGLERSNVEVEVRKPKDMEIIREPDNKDCNISGSAGTMSFEPEPVPDDVDTPAESSTIADKLKKEEQLIDTNAPPSENNSASNSLPFSAPFNSDAKPEENLVEELLKFDHEEPASEGNSPSSLLADDAVPNDRTSNKQEPGAIAAHNAEEIVTGLSNVVLDSCSLRLSDNMGENLDSGTKDDAAAESSTLADKLIEEGPLVDANASPSENNSTSNPFSDSFNSNTRLEENQVEELLQFDHKAPASKDVCPSSVLAEDAVPNEITLDKHEHGSIASDKAEGLSDEVLDNCSLSQSDNMEEDLDSGFKEQSETRFVVTEGVTYGEQEPASKDLCPSSALADDAIPNDVTSDKQEHGAVATDNTEEFDTGLSDEVLDNMEENLDAVLKEQSETGYDEQEPENKGLYPSSVFSDNAVPNDKAPDKLEHGAFLVDDAEEFDTGSSNEFLDNCSANQSDNMEEKLDSAFKEQSETRCIVSDGVNYSEQELTVTDYEKEFGAGLSSNVSLDNVSAFNPTNEMEVKNSESGSMEQAEADSGPMEQAEAESDPMEQAEAESDPMERAEAESESDPMEQAEAESDPVEAKYDLDAPTITSQGEIHAEEYANLEAAASENTVSSPIKAVQDLQEPGILDDDIALHVTPSEDGDEEKQGEELRILFSTPQYDSHSKEGKKASLDGDSRDKGLNREAQVSPIRGKDTLSPQSSVRDCSEPGQGEYLKSLFATPFSSRRSKVEIATCIGVNETSSQYKHSFNEMENTASSAGNCLTQSVAPLKDTSEDEAGEELRGLFATPSVVSQSVGGQHSLFQSQLSGKENLRESVGGLIEDKQVEHLRTSFASPVSVKCTNQETTSTKGKYSQSHEMKTYIFSGVERNLCDSEAGSVGVDQVPETSHITPFNYGDENEQEDQSDMLFASPIPTRSLDQIEGTSRKTAEQKKLLSGSVQGFSHNKVFSVAQLSSMDLEEPEGKDSKHSETAQCMKESRGLEEENNEGQGNMQSATSAKSMTPLWSGEFSSQDATFKETAEYMKESRALEEENYEGQGNMQSATSAKRMTPLWSDEFSSQEPTIKGTAEYMKESSALEEENNEGQGNMLSAASAKNTTPFQNDEFSSQEPKRADVAMPGEMFRDIEETVADRDLLLSDTSRDLDEDIYVGIANESTFVISDPTCDHDIGFSEQKMVLEINKSSLENVKTSDAFNEGTEDHLNLLFATPIKGTSPSRWDEASSCQLKSAMIAMASEMAGKQPTHGIEFSGESLTVEIINGGSDSTKRSCFSKENEQFEGGPLFPTPSKGTSPLQLEESPGCLEDFFKDLDGVKFLNFQEQNFAQHEGRQFLNEMTDDTDEATLHWSTNDDSVPRNTERETQKENDSTHPFGPLHEKGEVTEDDALAEGKEDRLINTDEAANVGAISDAVCQQPNILLTDIETENITQESIRKTDGISVGAEHYVVENVSSTEELTASTNECQHVFKEDDLAAERDRFATFESNESSSMNVLDSGLTTQMDHSALSEEPPSESDQGKSSAAKQQDEDSFDKKEHESTEAVLSPSSKSRENISFIKEGFADEVKLMSEKKNDMAEKKVPLSPAGVAKTSFSRHLNSTVKKKNARSILIHGTPNKLAQIADMKENAPIVKGDIGTLTALRPEKRLALKHLPWK